MTAMNSRDRILEKRALLAADRSKGIRPYKFRPGTTKFRILPMSTDKMADWDRRYGKTYLKGFDNKLLFAIVDKDVTYGQSDTIREMIFDAMRQAPTEEIKKHYQDLLSSPKRVFNALILDDPQQSPTEPVIVEISEGAFDNICAQFLVWSENDHDYDLAALDTGHVFQVDKTGSGMDTRYTWMATPQKAPLNAAMVQKAIDLDAWILSQVEGLEGKALEAIGRINGAVGITTTMPSVAISAQPVSGNTGVSPAAVTTAIEPDIEDAVVEEISVEVAPVTVTGTSAVETPIATPAVEPAAVATPAATPAAGDLDLESILAELNG